MLSHKRTLISFCLIGSFLLTGCTTLQKKIPDIFKSNEEIKLEQAMEDLNKARCNHDRITEASNSACDSDKAPPPKTALSITGNLGKAPSPLMITIPSSLAYTVGKPYSYQLQASGGLAPIRFSLASGSSRLPPDLSLSQTGLISGTGKSAGSYGFTVEATDSSSPPVTTRTDITITGSQAQPPEPKPAAATGTVRICIDYAASPANIVITPSPAASSAPASGTICIEYNPSPGNIVITPSPTAGGTAAKAKTSESESKSACKTPATVSEGVVTIRRHHVKEREAYVEVLKSELAVTLASLEKASKDAGFFFMGLRGAGVASGIAAAALTAANAAANMPWTMGLGVFTTSILALQQEATGAGFSTAIAEQKLDILKDKANTAYSELAASSSWAYLDEYAESAAPECWETAMKELDDKVGKFESVVRYTKFGIKVQAETVPNAGPDQKQQPAQKQDSGQKLGSAPQSAPAGGKSK